MSKSVAVKTETQQVVLGLHRMREAVGEVSHDAICSFRGLLTEYGEVMATGRAALDKTIPAELGRLGDRLPAILIDSLREQWSALAELDKQIAQIEQRTQTWTNEDRA